VNHNFDNLNKIFTDSCFRRAHNNCRRVVIINGEWDQSHPQAGFYHVFMEHHQGVEVISKKVYTEALEAFKKIPKNITQDRLEKLLPSSGFFALHWLREADVCGKLTVYGMPSDAEEAGDEMDQSTYKDVDTGVEMYDCHDIKAEHAFIKEKVVGGEWKDVKIKY